jgi:hypothetical protein
MNLLILYTALSVVGLGVTIIDFLGVLNHGDEDSGSGDQSGETDDGGGDAGDDGHDIGDDSGDGGYDIGDHDSGDDGHDSSDTESGGHGDDGGQSGHDAHDHSSYLSPGSSGIKAVTAVMALLRTAVYFSFGAGPTGLFALFRGLAQGQSLLWAAGVGTGTAFLARALRKFLRRDLDSSIKPEEFLMEKAVLLLPLGPGTIAKAVVRQYGKETEIYVKCRDPRAAMKKGTEARIIDFDHELYWIEAVDEKE